MWCPNLVSAKQEILRLAARLERSSEHPLAASIVHAATERKASIAEPAESESVTGQGLRGRIEGHRVALDNARPMEAENVTLADPGATALFVAVDGKRGTPGLCYFRLLASGRC
jgi:P-type Cu+ transporter